MLEKFFRLQEHGTTVRTELLAGLTTFAAMSYVLVVNPGILSAGGVPVAGLITVTALASIAGTLLMAFLTNYPVVLAPGMGLNAYFAFTVCLAYEVPWPAALGMVFWNGVIFLLLSVTGVRTKIADAIPKSLKIGVQCGIGLFIAFLGLKSAGIIAKHEVTFVTIGNLSEPSALLVLFGIVLTVILVIKRVAGAIILSVLAVTFIGLFVPHGENGFVTSRPEGIIGLPKSIDQTFLAMDLMYPIHNIKDSWIIIFAMLFVNMFDTIGTLIGVSRKAGLLDENDRLPKMGNALTADAGATVIGACLGTSTVTSYVESAAGVAAGGRTGLTALTVAVCFLIALFFSPVLSIIPLMATAPALIMVGIFMMESIRHLDFDDLAALAPAFVTLLAMPLSFSISEGIALGFIVYVGVSAFTGKLRTITPLTYALALVFLLRYIFDLK